MIGNFRVAAACRLLKERKVEDHLFGDKDKFVTAAYKRKLEEDQKWLAEEKIREARDAKQDVTKAGHMGNFYRCFLHLPFIPWRWVPCCRRQLAGPLQLGISHPRESSPSVTESGTVYPHCYCQVCLTVEPDSATDPHG